jgi:cytochrome c oxidase subunit 3
VALTGARSNSAGSFLLVIAGLHLLHIVGGMIALVVISLKAMAAKSSSNQVLSVELAATYWHFVDILWIYLFVFLNWIG